MVEKKSSKKKKGKKKGNLQEKINDHRKYIIIGVGVLLAIIIVICLVRNISDEETKNPLETPEIFISEFSPLELSQQKEELEGKTITVLGAYVPSEAFIYIKEANDRIYLKPTNPNYCRNYNLKGVLRYNYITSKWGLEVENYDDCLD